MEKFSILRLDVNKLNREICNFEYKENERPCIFVRGNTFKTICPAVDLKHSSSFVKSQSEGLLADLDSYKVFIDDSLDFGEIVLRKEGE